jgi:hypothetical protein
VYDPRSKGAESYIRLAKEIIERQPSAVSSQPSAETLTAEGQAEEAVQEIAAAVPEMDKTA